MTAKDVKRTPELVIRIEAGKVVDNEPLQEKIKKICETYKDYRLRIEIGEQEELTGW